MYVSEVGRHGRPMKKTEVLSNEEPWAADVGEPRAALELPHIHIPPMSPFGPAFWKTSMSGLNSHIQATDLCEKPICHLKLIVRPCQRDLSSQRTAFNRRSISSLTSKSRKMLATHLCSSSKAMFLPMQLRRPDPKFRSAWRMALSLPW